MRLCLEFALFLCNIIEIALSYGCFPVNLLHIFRPPFPKNTSGGGFYISKILLQMAAVITKVQFFSHRTISDIAYSYCFFIAVIMVSSGGTI